MARHAIHVSEVLNVTIQTMEGLQRHQTAIHESLFPDLKNYTEYAKDYTSFQLQSLKSLKLRSDSNLDRLRNEITLAFNMIARKDNAVMRSIAILTMIFLPATFITAFFSTNFFDYSDNDWKISKKLWVYWIITIPATALIILVWRVWLSLPVQSFLEAFSWKAFFKRKGKKRAKVNDSTV